MVEIAVSGIEKSFGSTRVLNDVSLTVADREFLTLVGPSGCGKSTLLRIIAGLEQQDAGSIAVDGQAVDRVRPRDRDLAMVFQSYALYPHLSVADNMAVPLRMRRLNAFQRLPLAGRLMPGARGQEHRIRQEVEQAAAMLDIGHLLHRRPAQLSGGQRQRVALGRAMVRQPKAFLMDEPLSNLDAKLRVHMRAEIAQLHRRLGATFIYVTHDQAEAMTMSDRIAVMMDGDILQLAPPQTVYADPVDLRVAEFIGSPKINVVDARMRGDGSIAAGNGALQVQASAAPDMPVHLAFRPEQARLAAPERALLRGRVTHLENLGSDLLVHLLADGPQGHSLVVRAAPGQKSVAMGETVGVDLGTALPLLFGPDGRRIAVTAARRPELVHG